MGGHTRRALGIDGLHCLLAVVKRMKGTNIFLIGLMAVGKSTVGKALSEHLQRPFFDSDTEIEARAGAEISWIFDVEGEAGFRRRECAVIEDLTQHDGIVLATGGGVVENPMNRAHLAERGTVIYLSSSLRRLVARVRNDRKRPLLQQGNSSEILGNLLKKREPLYMEIADYRFDTSAKKVDHLVNLILQRLREDAVV